MAWQPKPINQTTLLKAESVDELAKAQDALKKSNDALAKSTGGKLKPEETGSTA